MFQFQELFNNPILLIGYLLYCIAVGFIVLKATKFINKKTDGYAVWPIIVICIVIYGSLLTSAFTQNWLIVAFCAGPMITNFLEDVIFPSH